ncbi:HAD family hydrolase [Maritimibacter sp. HL-12]|uniref:HAD family hydrolase n=1 Tax=Maritimibacter sp. HL-12 TaxID=1162418 RepID=UPI000A0EFC25|nr:HAD family hydrolase [Maritimibacter sp. HL-12]SMH45461.1 haloacid dehalogenase superfamily, subfamily IA, variant 3 with third motif having DD or ED [Maritimibacter sp. HL-12]
MTLKALIFDVDGTLAETEEAHREAFNRVFVEWGLDWHWSQPLYRDLLQTTGGKERIRAWQDRLPNDAPRLSDADIARIHLEKTAIYTGILATGELELRTGVAELIEAARAEGLRLAVATTTNMPNVAALTRCCWNAAPFEVFDVIAAGDEVDAKKPAPDVFELALERLGLPPGACIAFEDSLNGLISARGAGLRVVVTPSIYTDDQDFSQAQLVTGNLAQLGLGDLAALLADEVAQ